MNCLRFVVKLLLVVGALNWGLVGFFQYDLVSHLLGGVDSMGARVVFSMVGVAGLFGICSLLRCCGSKSGSCGSGSCGSGCNCNCHKK